MNNRLTIPRNSLLSKPFQGIKLSTPSSMSACVLIPYAALITTPQKNINAASNCCTLETLDCTHVVCDGTYMYSDVELTGDCTVSIAQACHNLKSFSFTGPHSQLFTSRSLVPIFHQNMALCQVNISGLLNVDSTQITNLLCSLPNLCTLRALFCSWLNDEVLVALVTAQDERKEQGGEIRLKTIGTVRSGVTIDAVRQFLEHQPAGRVESKSG